MNSRIFFALMALMAIAYAVDITFTPVTGFGAEEMVATPMSLGLTNGAGSSLTQVSFTIACNTTGGVSWSFGNGATKATVGTIANGATGYGYWTLLGNSGGYALTFNVTYKKSLVTYYTSFSAPLTVSTSSGGSSRSIQIDLAEIDAARSNSNDDDDDADANVNNNAAPAAQIVVAPSSVAIYSSEATWVPFAVKNTAGRRIRAVTYAVMSSSNAVTVTYPGSCAPANGLGDINKNQWSNTSYQISGPAGTYTLAVKVHYKANNSWKTFTQNVVLTIQSGTPARSALEKLAYNEDNSMKTEYVVGFGVGIACFAGLAVVGAAIMYRKRNAAATIA